MVKKTADEPTTKPGKAKKPGKSKKSDDGKGAGREAKALAKDVERLRATVDKLEARLEKSERKVDKWKGEAKAERTRSAKLEAKLRRARAERPGDHAVDSGDVPVEPPADDTAVPVVAVSPAVTTVEDTQRPDASWTVVKLRAAARDAGVVGASRKTKAQLLEALAG